VQQFNVDFLDNKATGSDSTRQQEVTQQVSQLLVFQAYERQ
jgi:hypothetical protein